MLTDANFLFEIGTEEIPAGYIPSAIRSVKEIFAKKLNDSRIEFNEIEVKATPRRIAITILNLADSQKVEEIELKGPSKKVGYDEDGNPSRALQGFLKGNGVTVEDLFFVDSGKGEYIFAKKKLSSDKTENIIPEIITEIVNTLPFPKRMKWSDKKVTYPRPIRYFLILFNNKVIDFEIEGIKSSNQTRGHFVQSNKMIEITDIKNYEKELKKNYVILDQDDRKEYIKNELLVAAEKAGGKLIDDPELLDLVTFIVENPHIVTCQFEEEFLEIPNIALIAEMREHQKYFAVEDKDGKLSNTFLVVSNNPVTDFIKTGNERVISARFSDARFFYNQDKKQKLADRVPSLKKVMFHKELGSIHDKIERMKKVGENISEIFKLDNDKKAKVDRAIEISKADLVTAMVIEFTSLQGGIGKIYALNDGEDPEVANAIEEHYKPKFNGDEVPKSIVSIILSLSEKIDNIFGSFSVGNIPKGSQDPYALRRQANAIVDIILQNELNISIETLLKNIVSNYKDGESLISKIVDFIDVRAKTIFSDRGLSFDEIEAVLNTGNSDYLETFRRASSINEFRKRENFSEMLISLKRMNNILSAFRRDNKNYELKFDKSLLNNESEKALYLFFEAKKEEIKTYISESKYSNLFELMIESKITIDNFFDNVMVMDENIQVRDNRLFILEDILSHFKGMIDFSKIVDKK